MKNFVEKVQPKHYFEEKLKSYELGKNMEKKLTHIEVHKLTIADLIEKYSKKSSSEFDAFYKMYKLQKYDLDYSKFIGTKYNSHSLAAYYRAIRKITKGENLDYYKKMYPALYNFITEIIKYTNEKPYLGMNHIIKKPKVRDLLKSAQLTKQDVEFINSKINKVREETEKGVMKMEKEIKTTKRKTYTRTYYNQETIDLIYQNCEKDFNVVQAMLPQVHRLTLRSYMNAFKRLKNNEKPSSIPSCLEKTFNKFNLVNTNNTNNTDTIGNYVLIMSDKIIEKNNSIEYLKGFMNADKKYNPNSTYKIAKLTELN
jgi:hypothetical protein